MAVSLKKGERISLTKDNPGLEKVIVGLGWDSAEKKGGFFGILSQPQQIDCDASALVLKGGRLCGNADIVYFGKLRHASGTVVHHGDNLTGDGAGDDEQIFIDLVHVPKEYDRIVVVVNIYHAVERSQHFGMIRNAFIRIVNEKTRAELCRYNLTDDYSKMTAMVFGELYRDGTEWKFAAVGQGTTDPGLAELCKRYVN